ncbi:MAG: TlpA disulfide reductase family protein [Methylotenera sp.]|nr:TlpA disulfide reductase family protein [Methylotenera sp.]
MKAIFAISLFIIFTSIGLADKATEVPMGQNLSDTSLRGLSVPSSKISAYKGKPLLINMWASWCGPCRDEMTSIQHLHLRYGGKKFNIIGISTDDEPQAAKQFIKTSALTFNNYIDHHLTLERMLGADTIPLTILVDANGRIVKKIYGARDWDSKQSIAMISNTLNVKL